MPAKSGKQLAMLYARAKKGEKWAQKFIKETPRSTRSKMMKQHHRNKKRKRRR